MSELSQAELEELAELEKLEKLKGQDIESLGDKQEPKPLIGKKRKREPKTLSYEYEEEREDLNSKQKISEKVSATKRRSVSKSTASSDKTVDF